MKINVQCEVKRGASYRGTEPRTQAAGTVRPVSGPGIPSLGFLTTLGE